MPMSMARNLATNLGLSVGKDSIISNMHLQSIFNGWLAEISKFHILAAVITCPQPLDSDSSIIFISKLVKEESENESLEEDGEALGVKNDIERWSWTLKVSLQWISLADHYSITCKGTQLYLNPPIFVKQSFTDLMASSEHYDHSRTIG
jgi:hypothetical protein